MNKGIIYVTSWDGTNQYDQVGNPVAYWHDKACCWIIFPEYEDYEFIYEKDSNGITEIPRACTIEYAKNWCGYNEDAPDINMLITYIEEGKTYTAKRYWGNLNYSESDAIINLGEYYRDKVLRDMKVLEIVLSYNDKEIWHWKNS